MAPPVPLLEVRRLACARGEARLFEDLDFALDAGEALQVQGANGAGKTSLLRILSGLTLPDEGEVYWRGKNIALHRPEFHAQLAYLGHLLGLKAELTVTENLRIATGMQGLAGSASRIVEVLNKVDLDHRADLPVRALSAGQRQRVALARLLLLNAVLWVLDEPFTALDAAGVLLVRALAEQHLEQGGLVILTSHQAVTLGVGLRKLELS